MNKYLKSFLGLLIILLPALFIAGIYFNKLTRKSFYENIGEVKLPGLKSKVKIYSDDYSVPHIIADKDDDLYFALGYVHARDRLWQMDITRRAAEGRLSELLGNATLEYDKLFRTIGINKFCYKLYNNISEKSKEILRAYSNGVNEFIKNHIKELPVEFDILNYRPEAWEPEHSLMIGRLMAWDLNINWYSDFIFSEIVRKVGIEKAAEIFPDTSISIYKKPKAADTVTFKIPVKKFIEEEEEFRPEHVPERKDTGEKLRGFFEIYSSYRDFFNLGVQNSGSNSWVISGSMSWNGKPILANDPHLNLQSPSKWYEVHLKDPAIDVTGMTVPGIPAVIIGHNRAICWGLTNLMNDDNDFISLPADSSEPGKYIYRNQSYYPDSASEKISVKNSDDIFYKVYSTKIGPVISDIKKPENISGQNNFITFKWTGFEYSDELECFYELSLAANPGEFQNALRKYGTPAQNFIFADTAGNIGYHAAGKIPVRKTNTWDFISFAADDEWTGMVEFDRLPHLFNPAEGFIITANTNPFSRPDVHDVFYISWTWEPGSRFDRIREMLKSRNTFTAGEFKLMQSDYKSPYAKEMSGFIVEAYNEHSPEDRSVSYALQKIKNWDGTFRQDSPEGAIYSAFLVRLIKNVFFDELGENLFTEFLRVNSLPVRSLLFLLKKSDSTDYAWFDDTSTPRPETKNEIIRKSFSEAVSFLREKFADAEVNLWQWGKLHSLKFMHILGTAAALDKTFNIGPYEIGGDYTTVNNSEYSLLKAVREGTFYCALGPSMRMVTDLSDITHSFSVNSTGQSGQPMEPDYYDQSRLWYYGDYKINVMDEKEMKDEQFKLLVLSPTPLF